MNLATSGLSDIRLWDITQQLWDKSNHHPSGHSRVSYINERISQNSSGSNFAKDASLY